MDYEQTRSKVKRDSLQKEIGYKQIPQLDVDAGILLY